MRYKTKIALLTLLTLSPTLFVGYVPITNAQQVIITLPTGSVPFGIVYDGLQTVWAVSYLQGALFKIDVQTRTYQTYFVRGTPAVIGLYAIAIDGDGNIWTTEKFTRKVAKFNPAASNFTEVSLIGGSADSVIYHEGFIWVANMPYVTKIDTATNQILQNYNLNGSPIWLKGDGGNIWVSKITEGNVSRFDIATGQVTLELNGFDRPLGVEADDNNVYIAENTIGPGGISTIAVYNKQTGQITRYFLAGITTAGTYLVSLDSYGNLWWSDNSDHVGVIGAKNHIYDATAPFQLFMTQVGEQMWFTADSYIIAIDIFPRDIAVTDVKPSKTVVGQGFNMSINVTVKNQGDTTENFNVTAYSNETVIQTKSITLTSGDSTTLTFTWNTTGFVKGSYTISAIASTIPNETNTTNNIKADGIVIVAMPCDIAGSTRTPPAPPDGLVNYRDVFWFLKAYGSDPTKPNWNPNTDMDNDNDVDYLDITILLQNFGRTYP